MTRSALAAVMMVVLLPSCSNNPSCADAVKSFYAAGCIVHDGNGSALSVDDETAACQATGAQVANNSTCQSDFYTYLTCIEGVEPLSSDPTTCNSCQVQQATYLSCQAGS